MLAQPKDRDRGSELPDRVSARFMTGTPMSLNVGGHGHAAVKVAN